MTLHLLRQNLWGVGVWLGGVICLVTMLLPADSAVRVVLVNAAGVAALLIFLAALLRMRSDARAVWWWMWVYLLLTVVGDLIYDVYRFHLDLAGSVPGWLGRGRAGKDLPRLFHRIEGEARRRCEHASRGR